MTVDMKFYETMVAYSKAIMDKCISDSEDAVRSISGVMDILLKDSTRISKMSSDTLDAMRSMEGLISSQDADHSSAKVKKLISALSGLVKEHRSVNDVVMPIIEALQFQDAIRQQMENLGKVMDVWLTARKEFGTAPDAEKLRTLGEKMLGLTTMQSERDIIRRHIPGLPEESKVEDVMLF